MFWGLFGRMRRRREEKRKELERIQEEKRAAKEQMMNQAWKDFAEAREAHRQRMYQEDMAALKVSSLDARRDQMQGVLTARRAYRDDVAKGRQVSNVTQSSAVSQSDDDVIAAQQFVQAVTHQTDTHSHSSSWNDAGCSGHTGSSDSGSSSGGDSGSCGGD